jgi:hypothetical protein
MNRLSIYALVLAAFTAPVSARVLLYPYSDFQGPSVAIENSAGRSGIVELNPSDRAASLIVEGEPWKACESSRFGGRCVVLLRGAYQTPESMGLEHRVASMQLAEARPDHAAPYLPRHEYR